MSLSVLMVEDSREIQSAIEDLLRDIGGYEVAARLQTETEATDWLESHGENWEVAVVDLVLKDGSGFNLIRRCKTANPAGRIVILSGYATPVIKVRCVELGADAVFNKGEVKAFSNYLNLLAGRDAVTT